MTEWEEFCAAHGLDDTDLTARDEFYQAMHEDRMEEEAKDRWLWRNG